MSKSGHLFLILKALKALRLHNESELFVCVFLFFSYSSSFPIKMLVTDVKTQKIEPDPNFFMTDESFGGSV